ncbi:MAG: MFS transporter [Chloroflexi bacterium]|nr:MFS transporter [Chloroflexota bacterium]
MKKRHSLFYGWIIAGLALVSMTLIFSVRSSFSVFLPPILADYNWSRGGTAFMLSLNLFVYGLVSPVAGMLADRWRPRRLILIGLVVLSLATAGSGFSRELWNFYILFGFLMPIGLALCGWPLWCAALANWFDEKRGLVMGIGQVGAGMSVIFALVVQVLISQGGWRIAFFSLGAIQLVVLGPLFLVFFYYRPDDKGMGPYGRTKNGDTNGVIRNTPTAANAVFPQWTLKKALKTYQLWLLILSHLLFWGVTSQSMLAHQVKFAEDVGYADQFAAGILALTGFSAVGGQMCGFLADRITKKKMFSFTCFLAILAIAFLLLVKDNSEPWLMYLYAVLFGYGIGIQVPIIYAQIADIFHGKHFGTIGALLLTGQGIGGAIGPWITGHLYDVYGSYRNAFVFLMACLVLSCLSFIVAAASRPPSFASR